MSEFKYKGRCFQCDNGNDVDGGEEGGEFDLGARWAICNHFLFAFLPAGLY